MKLIPSLFGPQVRHALGRRPVLGGSESLMAGWIHTESNWNPNAVRWEGGFYKRYVRRLGLGGTESLCRAMSWGLLQIMGQVAREYGYRGEYLPGLCEPAVNLSMATRILTYNHGKAGTWQGALAAYNGGLKGNIEPPYRNQFYVDKVLEAAKQYGWKGELT